MRKQWKGFISGVAVALLCVGLVGTAAATVGSRVLTADYNDIKIVVNGQHVAPTDANGSVVEPFAIDGTTYLPVRAVGSALGLAVDWDGSTSTVCLSSDPGELLALEACSYMIKLSDKVHIFTIAAKSCATQEEVESLLQDFGDEPGILTMQTTMGEKISFVSTGTPYYRFILNAKDAIDNQIGCLHSMSDFFNTESIFSGMAAAESPYWVTAIDSLDDAINAVMGSHP